MKLLDDCSSFLVGVSACSLAPTICPVRLMTLSVAIPNWCISPSSFFPSSLWGATHPHLRAVFSPTQGFLWVYCASILVLTFDHLAAIPPLLFQSHYWHHSMETHLFRQHSFPTQTWITNPTKLWIFSFTKYHSFTHFPVEYSAFLFMIILPSITDIQYIYTYVSTSCHLFTG